MHRASLLGSGVSYTTTPERYVHEPLAPVEGTRSSAYRNATTESETTLASQRYPRLARHRVQHQTPSREEPDAPTVEARSQTVHVCVLFSYSTLPSYCKQPASAACRLGLGISRASSPSLRTPSAAFKS